MGPGFSAFQLTLDLHLAAFPTLQSAQDFLGWAGRSTQYLEKSMKSLSSIWTSNGPLDLKKSVHVEPALTLCLCSL